MSSTARQHHTHGLRGADDEVEQLLEQFEPLMIALVREAVRGQHDFARIEVFDLEFDELVQRVRIKFWYALEAHPITSPAAYLRTIVRSEFIDMMRGRPKQLQVASLVTDQDGEIRWGRALISPGEGLGDPAEVLASQEEVSELMEKTVDAVLRLSNRQRLAMICTLHERVDDLRAFLYICKKRRFDVDAWLNTLRGNRLLQASLSIARQKLRKEIGRSPRKRRYYRRPR